MLAITRVRHDRREAGHLPGVADGQGLADHAAHRDAHNVGRGDPEMIQ